ncbi:Depupylase [Anatilimnocola aggregata]|uniref:Depupylase n=1 Tax=Anatilimnocola aggregata TaxID=2528021 RepID=A0A517YJD2_9BACT|nr:proteasome accessory factor PafA2 family protein [Anatilimnocola aggregata]QDU30329.1 Depupylase [Anatilimnocola aggregata]
MASKPAIFERLIGLETEYALAISNSAAAYTEASEPGGKYRVYRHLVAEVRKRVPTVEARNMKEGIFHAAGGAVWFEAERPAAGGGLIEGATPECRSPRQLLAWQRAQDELLSQAASAAFGDEVRLLKNDRDAHGNIYGAQENYEVDLASGFGLIAWRISLVLVLPLAALTWIALWLLIGIGRTYTLLALIGYLIASRWMKEPQGLARVLFGCELERLEEAGPTGPRWLEATLAVVTRVLIFPIAIALYCPLELFAFRKLRRQLTPFLISRPIIAGTGMIDNDGKFHLADKAPAMNCLTGYGGMLADRPVYSFGHFFKTAYADAWLDPLEYASLFQQRQRLQIALGDSNRADVAEYLRIGTTLLVIDAIEAGCLPAVARIRQPLRALRAICADPTLKFQIPLVGKRTCTAIELQRFYLDACRAFVDQADNPPTEARQILRLWEETLDALEEDPQDLVGSLDWVTKQFLLSKAGPDAAWEVRKKIDLRYSELSDEGYFERLRSTGITEQLLAPAEIDYALRNPPTGTPATVRGRYIREFSGGEEAIAVNWQRIYLGSGRKERQIDLSRYRPLHPPAPRASSKKSRRKDRGA